MSDSDRGEVAALAVAYLQDAVTELITLARANPTGAAALRLLQALETQRNRLAVAEHAAIAEVEAQGLAYEYACRGTAALLSQALRISPTDAAARVRAAADLGPRRGLTGEARPPLFERVAAAQASGALSPAHARVITTTIDALPAAVQAEHEDAVQESLVRHAHALNPASWPPSPAGPAITSTPTASWPPNTTGSGAASWRFTRAATARPASRAN